MSSMASRSSLSAAARLPSPTGPPLNFSMIVINSLRATGDARFPLYAGLLSQWCVMALGGWLLGTWFGFGLVGVWCAFLIDEWFRGLAMQHRWKKRRWLN